MGFPIHMTTSFKQGFGVTVCTLLTYHLRHCCNAGSDPRRKKMWVWLVTAVLGGSRNYSVCTKWCWHPGFIHLMAVVTVVRQRFVDQASSCLAPFIPGSCILVQDRSSAGIWLFGFRVKQHILDWENETPSLRRLKDIRHMGSGLCEIGEYANTKKNVRFQREHYFPTIGSWFQISDAPGLSPTYIILVVGPATKIENPHPTARILTQKDARACLAGPLPWCGPLGYCCSMSIPLLLRCNEFSGRGDGFLVLDTPIFFWGIAIQSRFSWSLRNYCEVLRLVLERTNTQIQMVR